MAEKKRKKAGLLPEKKHFVTIESGRRLVMEAVEEIVFCNAEKIVLQGSLFLEIEGEGLKLVELGNDNMAVEGIIRSVLFSEKPL